MAVLTFLSTLNSTKVPRRTTSWIILVLTNPHPRRQTKTNNMITPPPTATEVSNSRVPQRRVRFEMDSGGSVQESFAEANHQLLESDLAQCWWQRHDFARFRESVNEFQMAAMEEGGMESAGIPGRRSSYHRTMSKVLKSVSKSSCNLPLSTSTMATTATRSLLSGATRKDLEYWTQVDESNPRGLEKFILTRERMRRRGRVVVSVLLMQHECLERRLPKHVSEKLIQEVSEKESTRCVKVAIVMAAADAVAAKAQEKDCEEGRTSIERSNGRRKVLFRRAVFANQWQYRRME